MFFGGPKENDISWTRYQAYVDCSTSNHIKINEDFILFGKFNAEFGTETINNHPLPKEVAAIVCGNDLIALGVINALHKKKLVYQMISA